MTLLLLAVLISKGQEVIWINGRHNASADVFFSQVTVMGDALCFIPVILALLFVRYQYAFLAAAVWLVSGLFCVLLKRGLFHDAKRPVEILDHATLYFVPGVNVHSHYSFPSGHTTTIFCITLLLALLVKKRVFTFAMIGAALTVGYSRIYLLQHFLIDVAMGAMIGSGITMALYQLFTNLKFSSWMYGRITFRNRNGSPDDDQHRRSILIYSEGREK